MTASPRAITRPEWGGIDFDPVLMGLVSTGFLHHTVTRATQALVPCMRDLEGHALSLGHRAIDYTNTAFAYGARAIGRGYGVTGGHTLNWNSKSYGQAAVGDYRYDPITEALLDELAANYADGVKGGYLTRNFELRPHFDVYPTACPSRLANVIPEIKRRTEAIVAGTTEPEPVLPKEEDMKIADEIEGARRTRLVGDRGWTIEFTGPRVTVYNIREDTLGFVAVGVETKRIHTAEFDRIPKAPLATGGGTDPAVVAAAVLAELRAHPLSPAA